jgi:hypothetical protein
MVQLPPLGGQQLVNWESTPPCYDVHARARNQWGKWQDPTGNNESNLTVNWASPTPLYDVNARKQGVVAGSSRTTGSKFNQVTPAHNLGINGRPCHGRRDQQTLAPEQMAASQAPGSTTTNATLDNSHGKFRSPIKARGSHQLLQQNVPRRHCHVASSGRVAGQMVPTGMPD